MNSHSNFDFGNEFYNLKIEQIKAYFHEFRNAWFNFMNLGMHGSI